MWEKNGNGECPRRKKNYCLIVCPVVYITDAVSKNGKNGNV